MLIHKHRARIITSSGSGSANTLKFSGTQLIQLFTDSLTSTNIYDISIIDEDGDEVYSLDAIEGGYEEHSIYVPLRGIYTITITNSTVDELIIVKLMVEE